MSGDPSVEFQTAIYERLVGDEELGDLVNGAIYDGWNATEENPTPVPSVTFGESDWTDEPFECGPAFNPSPDTDSGSALRVRSETITLHAWRGTDSRLWPVKELTGAIVKALRREALVLPSFPEVTVTIESVRHMLDPDGLTGHGVVTVTAEIEESTS